MHTCQVAGGKGWGAHRTRQAAGRGRQPSVVRVNRAGFGCSRRAPVTSYRARSPDRLTHKWAAISWARRGTPGWRQVSFPKSGLRAERDRLRLATARIAAGCPGAAHPVETAPAAVLLRRHCRPGRGLVAE